MSPQLPYQPSLFRFLHGTIVVLALKTMARLKSPAIPPGKQRFSGRELRWPHLCPEPKAQHNSNRIAEGLR